MGLRLFTFSGVAAATTIFSLVLPQLPEKISIVFKIFKPFLTMSTDWLKTLPFKFKIKKVDENLSTNPSWLICWGEIQNFHSKITWKDEKVAIFHSQPTLSPTQRFVLVGEINLLNRIQLCRRWQLNSQSFKKDDELVAQLLDCHCDEASILSIVSQLEGMFEMVVWDRQQQNLSLIRDPVGCKTLYYTLPSPTMWIAPRLKTLLPHHSRELDLVALGDYLSCAFVPGERTLWREVKELRPGTLLNFSTSLKHPKTEVYWQPKETIQNPDQSPEWHAQKLRSLLNQVVQESLPNGQPAGVYLSGGLDSSCITALTTQFHRDPVHTYSIHFGSDYPNELEFSSQVAEHCQTQHHILEITPNDLWEKLPITLANLDDPIGDPLTVPNFLLGQFAQQTVGIILNGEGGDPCFGGPKNKPMLLNQLYGNIAPQSDDLIAAYLNSFKKCFSDLPDLVKPEVLNAIKTATSVFESDLSARIDYLNRLMLLNIKFKGADHILTKVNNLTAAAGILGYSPLFDRRIVELSLEIPPKYKLSGANEKAVLKKAVEDLLPSVIINRPKSGMMVPVGYWFRSRWKRRAQSLLLNKKAEIAPYFNQNIIREWLNYRGDRYNRYGVKLWLLTSLEMWLQVNKKY